MLDGSTIIARNPRAAFRTLSDGSAVLLHLDTADYHSVNEVGALVWDLIGDSPTLETLVVRMEDAFEEHPPGLQDDVESFVEELAARDLVVVTRTSPAT